MATATKFKINGRTLAPEVPLPSPSATVLDLKQAIQSMLGVPVARQRLFHKGDGELLNHRTIQSYNLKAEERKSVANLDLTVEPLPKKRRGERISFVVKCGDEKATLNLRETDTLRDLRWEIYGRFKTCTPTELRCAGVTLPWPVCHGDDSDDVDLYEYYLSEGTVFEAAAARLESSHIYGPKTFPPSFYNSQ
ncbi:unnamed protein product [Linum trigynum]|uniref:Ubiquitin-like domain-containing protein n=1 Tax=Linum trigynum TaxID=586398 RepID=A0AAV2ENW8_9ROSI